MKIINQSVEILSEISPGAVKELKAIELAGRTAYKSEHNITVSVDSAKEFIAKIIRCGHESVLEHSSLMVRFITDRGVSHEIVRHRIASYTQMSTRYYDYSAERHGAEIVVVDQGLDGIAYEDWKSACEYAESVYMEMRKARVAPEIARAVLPTCLMTELVMTMNYREARHFIKLRSDVHAHPMIRELAIMLLNQLKERIPVVFDDIHPEG